MADTDPEQRIADLERIVRQEQADKVVMARELMKLRKLVSAK